MSNETTAKEAAETIMDGFQKAYESGPSAFELGWYGFVSRDDVLEVATFLTGRGKPA